MDEINYLLASVNLNKNIEKIRASVNEIKEKNPNRVDLINSMEESIKELMHVKIMYSKIEKHNLAMQTGLMNYQKISIELKAHNIELEKKNNELMKNIEL